MFSYDSLVMIKELSMVPQVNDLESYGLWGLYGAEYLMGIRRESNPSNGLWGHVYVDGLCVPGGLRQRPMKMVPLVDIRHS